MLPAGAKRTSMPISLMSAVRAGQSGGAGHLLDIGEIGKARQPLRLGAREIGGDQTAFADHVEQRHAVGIVDGAEQIVDQAGDEHGLAGAAQARHREPDRRAPRPVRLSRSPWPAVRTPARRWAATSSIDHGLIIRFRGPIRVAAQRERHAVGSRAACAAQVDARGERSSRNLGQCSIVSISNRCSSLPSSPR